MIGQRNDGPRDGETVNPISSDRLRALAFLVVLLAFSCGTPKPPPEEAAATIGVRIGNTAPAWELPRLDGAGMFRSEDVRGKVVILNFWASWCGPCKRELPELQKLYGEYAEQGVLVVGISVDDIAGQARSMAKELGITFPLVLDVSSQATASTYPFGTLPTSLVLDRRGRVRAKHSGYTPITIRQMRSEIETILKEAANETNTQ